jgi:hypothetical protein
MINWCPSVWVALFFWWLGDSCRELRIDLNSSGRRLCYFVAALLIGGERRSKMRAGVGVWAEEMSICSPWKVWLLALLCNNLWRAGTGMSSNAYLAS